MAVTKEQIIASLRKKVGPFVQPVSRLPAARMRRSEADAVREDAITILMQTGLKRPEAQRSVDQLLATRDDITTVQDIITQLFRTQNSRHDRSG